MAKKLNPETATIREVAELYATEQKLDMSPKAYGNLAASYLPQGYADQPGSALGAFMTGDDGDTLLKGIFTSLDLDVTNPKTSMQALRMMGLRLKKDLPANSNLLPFLPDEAPDTPKNEGIFGIKEPPKSVSEVAILTDKATMQEMFRQIMVIAQDPKQEAAAMATLFNLQNGLRPNAAGMLRTDSYYPESRAIYIPAEAKGAKGRKVNVPLNDIADSILQMRLQSGAASESYFFVKPNGNPVKSPDITDILAQVKIPKLIYDSGLKEYFNSLAPDYEKGQRDTVPGKRGSPLIRNIHTKIAQRNGVPFERIAYLQGRSLKAAAEGSVGEVTTYAQDYPGDLDAKGPDVRNANVVSSYFAEAAEDAGFSIPESLGVPTQRVGRATPGYEKYFEAPVIEDPAVDAETTRAANNIAAGGAEYVPYTDSQIEELKTAGLWNDEMQSRHDEFMAKQQGSTTGQKLGVGIAAAGVGMALLDPAQALADEAIQQTGEAATRSIVGKTIARRIPFAEVLIPSNMGVEPQENLARAYNRPAQDFYDMTPEQMAPYQQALDDAIAQQQQEAVARRRGRNRARVGSSFLETPQQP